MRKSCCDKKDSNKGAWSKQEDQKLIEHIRRHGEGSWRTLPQAAGLLRCGKSCRLRWNNYLRPDLKSGNFAEDEEDLIIKLHALLGNRWSLIAGRLPGRTDNEVKNYWNSHLRKKLTNMGVDPKNHRVNQSLSRPCENCGNTSRSSQPINTGGNINDQVSDAGSCLEDASTGGLLPDLNLNLGMMTTPSIAMLEEEEREENESTISMELESSPPPSTLVLFS